MTRFIHSLGLISFGLLLGYSIQLATRRGFIRSYLPAVDLRKLLQRVALLFINPVAILGAVWVVHVESIKLAALPFIGVFALLAGGLLALAAAKRLALSHRKTGALFGCGSFTNIGSIGALVCFVFLGEPGFALVTVLACSAAYVAGFGDIDGGLPLKVVMILSSMPLAFNALIPPSLYDLDLNLANSCWFVTTALLIVVLPIQLWVVSSF